MQVANNAEQLPLVKRFLEGVSLSLAGCWIWNGRHDYYGYGLFVLAGRVQSAHVIAYELWVGPRPDGLVLDHLCEVKDCVNYHHLRPVTQRENILRGNSPAAKNARKTHCLRGHPFDEGNTVVLDYRGVERRCRMCVNLRAQKYRDARREKVLEVV